MELVIGRANDWPYERVAPFVPSIGVCLQKLVEEFPDDYTVDFLAGVIDSQERDLWIVYDPDEPTEAVLIVLVHVIVRPATGSHLVEITECGGSRIDEALPLLKEIEAWAMRECGVKRVHVTGRFGWSRKLRSQGYVRRIETLEKRLGG